MRLSICFSNNESQFNSLYYIEIIQFTLCFWVVLILYPISSTKQTTELVLSCRLRYIAYNSQSLMRIQLSSKLVRDSATLLLCIYIDRVNTTVKTMQFFLRWIGFCYKLERYLYNSQPFTLTLKCRYSVFVGYLLTNNNRYFDMLKNDFKNTIA